MYLICLLAWKNYAAYLTRFFAFNAKYNQAYADAALAAAEAAAALPGSPARKAATKIKRNALSKSAKKCLNLYKLLVRYIDNCYEAAIAENM